MNGRWLVLLVVCVVLVLGTPVVGQSGPGFSDCDDGLLAEFQAWDATFHALLDALPQSRAEARDRLTGHLETGWRYGEVDCAVVRASYFEGVARVYAMMTWTTTAALHEFDPNAGMYLGDLTEKAARMTGWIRTAAQAVEMELGDE